MLMFATLMLCVMRCTTMSSKAAGEVDDPPAPAFVKTLAPAQRDSRGHAAQRVEPVADRRVGADGVDDREGPTVPPAFCVNPLE
jgi:hypothetical protein